MKLFVSIIFVPLLVMASGCSTRVSSTHGHHYGHHNHVSVGVHGRSSGAGILGALIVGGVINSLIHESQHHDEEDLTGVAVRQDRSEQDELVNGYELDNTRETPLEKQQSDSFNTELTEYENSQSEQVNAVEWYQVGKDGNCYRMRVNNGITDIVSAVPQKQCEV